MKSKFLSIAAAVGFFFGYITCIVVTENLVTKPGEENVIDVITVDAGITISSEKVPGKSMGMMVKTDKGFHFHTLDNHSFLIGQTVELQILKGETFDQVWIGKALGNDPIKIYKVVGL